MEFKNLEELEATLGTLDRAELRPVTVGGSSDPTQSYVAIWNKTRNNLETIVPRGKSTVIQHADALGSFIRAAKDKGIETKGELHNFGGHVIVEATFPNLVVDDGSKGGIQLGVRLENNFDSRGYPSFKGEGYGLRLVCTNGMRLPSMIATIFSQHTKVATLDKHMLRFLESMLKESVQIVKDWVVAAKADAFETPQQIEDVLAGEINFSKKIALEVKKLLEKEDNTRYTLYNSITQYATHDAKSDRLRQRLQRVAQKVLVNPIKDLNTATWGA